MVKNELSLEEKMKNERIEKLAVKVLSLARDQIVVNLRFLDIAVSAMKLVPMNTIIEREDKSEGGMATDGISIYYNPTWVLKTYEKEPNMVARTYLHLLLHLLFFHGFQYDKVDMAAWDMAADIAVENTILSMELPSVTVKQDMEMGEKLARTRSGSLPIPGTVDLGDSEPVIRPVFRPSSLFAIPLMWV